MTCSECGDDIRPGTWPFCHGKPGKHVDVTLGFFTGNAQRFDPVVVFRDRQGQIIVPGHSAEPPPPGCQRVEATDIRQVRALERRIQNQTKAERERNDEQRARARELAGVPSDDAQQRERRARLKQKMQNFSPEGKAFAEHTMKRMDDIRAKKVQHKNYDPGGGFQAFNVDRSNRPGFDDPATGKKDRG